MDIGLVSQLMERYNFDTWETAYDGQLRCINLLFESTYPCTNTDASTFVIRLVTYL